MTFIAYFSFLIVGLILGLVLGYAVRDAEHKSKGSGMDFGAALRSGVLDADIERVNMRNNQRKGQAST